MTATAPSFAFSDPVPNACVDKAIWLSDAWRHFPLNGREEALAAEERFKVASDGLAPEHIPLADHTRETHRAYAATLDAEAQAAWNLYWGQKHVAEIDLAHALTWWMVACAMPAMGGTAFRWIPTQDWHHLKIDQNERNTASGDGVTYRYIKVLSFDDVLKHLDTVPAKCNEITISKKLAFDSEKAAWHLTAAKRTGEDRPGDARMNELLIPHFLNVPRDSARQVVNRVWGKGARGRPRKKN